METLQIRTNYLPHSHQAEFHKDRWNVFARLISAGTGGGKTLAGAYECLLWAFENRGSVGYAFAPTYKMVKRNLIPALESPFLLGAPLETSPLVKDYNQTDSKITFINRTQLWLIGLEDPESAEGPNVDWIWSDESRLLHHFDTAWQVWMRRLRGSHPDLNRGASQRIGIWLTTTPDAPGSPLFNKFENPKTRLPNSQVYRWGIDDNPHLPQSYREEVRRSHSGGLAERFVYGRFAAVAVGSFAFDYTRHVLSPDAGMPVFKEIRYGVDFGWTNPTAIVAIGFDNDGRAYVLGEYYQSRIRTEDLISAAREMVQEYGQGVFICDRSEPATIEELRRAGLNAQADESKRDDGLRALGGRFNDAGDGRCRLYVSSRCVNLISELQTYSAERKENDHAVDALRYAVAGSGAIPPPPAYF